MGRFRTNELIFDSTGKYANSLPVSTATTVPFPGGVSVPALDAYDLVGYVATSKEGTSCFTRQAFRYLQERREDQGDSCELLTTQKMVLDPTKSVMDSLTELIGNSQIFDKQN